MRLIAKYKEMDNLTQTALIRAKLEAGEAVSRNWALSKYIGRLASRINDLKNDGLDIVGYPVPYINEAGKKCRDYEYSLVKGQAKLL